MSNCHLARVLVRSHRQVSTGQRPWRITKRKLPTMEDLTTPDEKGDIAFQSMSQDPWNQDYIIKELDGRKFEVISCGPDEEEGTDDDIRYPPVDDDQ